jgi:hypothetical protein
MHDVSFLEHLRDNNVKLALHGDVHEMRRDVVRAWSPAKLHVVGVGSFGACGAARPESTPRLYNVLEIQRDLKSIRVHTRQQRTPDGAWGGWHEWEPPDGGDGRLAYYDLPL